MSLTTKHGELRIRKRLGLPKKTVERQAERALAEGKTTDDFKGSFKNYLAWQQIEYKSTPRIYKGYIYFFSGDKKLITCWVVPNQYRKYL